MNKILIASALTLASLAAHAAGGSYIGVQVGKAKMPYRCTEGMSCDHSTNVFQIYAGTRLSDSQQLDVAGLGKVDAVEVRYVRAQGVDTSGQTIKNFFEIDGNGFSVIDQRLVPYRSRLSFDAIALAPVLNIPLQNDLQAFAKLGAAWVTTTAAVRIDGTSDRSQSANKLKPYAALGLAYEVQPGIKFTGSAEFLGYEVAGYKGTYRSVQVGAQVGF